MSVLYIKWLATDNYITIHVNVMDVMLTQLPHCDFFQYGNKVYSGKIVVNTVIYIIYTSIMN